MTTTCRLTIAAPTRLDVLLDQAWAVAEECFAEPTNLEAKARLRALNAEIDRARTAEGA